MKLDRPDLTVDQLGDDIWLAVEGTPWTCSCGRVFAAHEWGVHQCPDNGWRTVQRSSLAPGEVRALLDPCYCWDGERAAPGDGMEPCPDCVDIEGRRKFDIVVPCLCRTRGMSMAFSGRDCEDCDGSGTVSRTYTVADIVVPCALCLGSGADPEWSCVCDDGTVTDDPALVRITTDMVFTGQPSIIVRSPVMVIQIPPRYWDGTEMVGPVTLVGATERSTHAIHVTKIHD